MSIIAHTICSEQPDYTDPRGATIFLIPSTLTEAEINDLSYYEALARAIDNLNDSSSEEIPQDIFSE